MILLKDSLNGSTLMKAKSKMNSKQFLLFVAICGFIFWVLTLGVYSQLTIKSKCDTGGSSFADFKAGTSDSFAFVSIHVDDYERNGVPGFFVFLAPREPLGLSFVFHQRLDFVPTSVVIEEVRDSEGALIDDPVAFRFRTDSNADGIYSPNVKLKGCIRYQEGTDLEVRGRFENLETGAKKSFSATVGLTLRKERRMTTGWMKRLYHDQF